MDMCTKKDLNFEFLFLDFVSAVFFSHYYAAEQAHAILEKLRCDPTQPRVTFAFC